MLRFLAEHSHLPVPRVLGNGENELWLEDMPGTHRADRSAAVHAAGLLASLHGVTSPDGRFGLGFDTAIGPLPQRNGWHSDWPAFFAECRLLALASSARDHGALDAKATARVEAIAGRLGELLPAHPAASLIHGDVWSGNVLSSEGRVTAFLDPSIAFAHAEVELAFIELFATFGSEFFAAYDERRPIEREYFRTRRDVYNLYPLLVHLRLFGDAYMGQLDGCLRRLKF